MKNLAIIIALLIAATSAAVAQSPTIVLTPTALYDLIEKQQIKTTKLTHVCLKLNQRINELEKDVARLKKASILTHEAVNKLRK